MSTDIQTIVIGAGVVGLAIARALAASGREVLILEAADAFGTETSARNSEVIHAGIYYAKDSWKARLCVAGKHALYDYCATHGIAHRRCGKLIVATSDEQVARLDSIRARAAVNGVGDLAPLSAAQARELEPHIHCLAALQSPSTGIIDSHGYMLSLLGEAEAHAAVIAYQAPVLNFKRHPEGWQVEAGGENSMTLVAAELVNSAGHGACQLAAGSDAFAPEQVPLPRIAKGNYFSLTARLPVSHLIYPVPEPGGLGVHVTLDLAGQVRFGPDVEWVSEMDYTVDPQRAEHFYARVRQYWPEMPDNCLAPDYAGIRPKIEQGGQVLDDFMISGPAEHGQRGCVNLFGIESPGLTASLALGQVVLEQLDKSIAY